MIHSKRFVAFGAFLFVLALPFVAGFLPGAHLVTVSRLTSNRLYVPSRQPITILNAEDEKKKPGVDPAIRPQLLAESIAPWRTLRLFLYFALGSGAFVGGLITLSGIAAAVNGLRNDIDLNTEVRMLTTGIKSIITF